MTVSPLKRCMETGPGLPLTITEKRIAIFSRLSDYLFFCLAGINKLRQGENALGRYRKILRYYSSHPLRYSLVRYLSAPGKFVIFIFTGSYSTRLPARRATAPRRIVSVTGPEF